MLKTLGKVGAVEIGRVLDSSLLGFTAQKWFPDFDRTQLKAHEHWLCPTHYDPECGRIPMPVHSWVLRIGKYTVLVDTCMGNDKDRVEFAEMHMLTNRYLERLAEKGLSPADIDYVLCTHLHVDHVGWNTRLENGRWVPTFPNAKYIFARREYLAAKEEARSDSAPGFIRNTFEDSVYPVVEAGQTELVDDDFQLLDCLTLQPAPGHSPGHIRIVLQSLGQLGVFAGDILHSPIQIPLWEWSSIVCWDKKMAANARRALLEFCADSNALLMPGHFECPHVGRIRRTGEAFSIRFGW